MHNIKMLNSASVQARSSLGDQIMKKSRMKLLVSRIRRIQAQAREPDSSVSDCEPLEEAW